MFKLALWYTDLSTEVKTFNTHKEFTIQYWVAVANPRVKYYEVI